MPKFAARSTSIVESILDRWPVIEHHPHRLVLAAILLLSLFFQTFRLGRVGFGNAYYAATVRSMTVSFHNFFFAAYDPAGFVSVDKPPAGFWVQAMSVKILGYNSWGLMLPQALATVLSVAILYDLVRRGWGVWAGIVAALTLTVTPIVIVTGRNNTIDSLLVLVLLAAAWAMLRANETNRLAWLVGSMALVGVGFNIKMGQAYLVLPALGALFLAGTRVRSWSLAARSLLAVAVLVVVSLSWAVIVEFVPAEARPRIPRNDSNSALSLAIDYNGLHRLEDPGFFGTEAGGVTFWESGDPPDGIGGRAENGLKGPSRLINDKLGPQLSWLMPFTLTGMILGFVSTGFQRRLPVSRAQQQLILWSVWFLTGAVFFSIAGFFHRHYLVTIAPATAALAGIGVVSLWRYYLRGGWHSTLLFLVIAATAALQLYFVIVASEWSSLLGPLVIGGLWIPVTALILDRNAPGGADRHSSRAALAVALILLLVLPAVWGSYAFHVVPNRILPAAGPGNTPPHWYRPAYALTRFERQVVDYLEENRGTERYFVAPVSTSSVTPIIIATGEPIWFTDTRRPGSNSPDLTDAVSDGDLRFVLLGANGNTFARWVVAECALVTDDQQVSLSGFDATLYDCAA